MAFSTLGSTLCEPIFLKNRDVYKENTNKLTSFEVCEAIANVVHERNVEGAQLIRGVWKIYMKTVTSRMELLQKGVVIRGIAVNLYEANPYTNQRDDSPVERILIKDLPLDLDNSVIEEYLKEQQGLVLKSKINYCKVRDESGQLTNFKNGDRFVYALYPVMPAMPENSTIDGHPCRFFHDSQDKYCKACKQNGHKTLSETCPAKNYKNNIHAFKSFQHVMSNHYPCNLHIYGKDFRSSEAAYLWMKAQTLHCPEVAEMIRQAKHAGASKAISREKLDGKENEEWLNKSVDVMTEILKVKSSQCKEFHQALLESEDNILAEAAPDEFWGTGLSVFLTENTQPKYWPGNNMLGIIQMELRQDLKSQQTRVPTPNHPTHVEDMLSHDHDKSSDSQMNQQEDTRNINTETKPMEKNNQDIDSQSESIGDISDIESNRENNSDSEDEDPNAINNRDESTKTSPSTAFLTKMSSVLFGAKSAKDQPATQKPITKYFKETESQKKKRRPTETPPKNESKRQNVESPFVLVESLSNTKETSNHPPLHI